MANGWINGTRVLFKSVGLSGDKFEQLIASYNPDAAIQLGKEDREALLQEVALKLAQLRQEVDTNRPSSLVSRHAVIVGELNVKKKAAAKVVELSKTGGTMPSEQAQSALLADMERLRSDAKVLEAQIAVKKTGIEFLEKVKNQRIDAIRTFDAEAASARNELEMANIRKQQADFTQELRGLASKGNGSTAGLGALKRAAAQKSAEADAAETVAGALESPTAKDDVMAQILHEAEHGPKGSTLSRLEEAAKS